MKLACISIDVISKACGDAFVGRLNQSRVKKEIK